MAESRPVAIIGGGFTGLSAGYELARAGIPVLVVEQEDSLGGLAGSFLPEDWAREGAVPLEKFYHHWFNNDAYLFELLGDLDLLDKVHLKPSNTGMYYAKDFFRLSSPLDLLRFTPLKFMDRLRLGLLALRARRVGDWRELESLTAEHWLRSLGGDAAFRVVWEPLLRGKFGDAAKEVSAVWFWNKLKLRGGSRGKGGAEELAYLEGGFDALVQVMRQKIEDAGGCVRTGTPVTGLSVQGSVISAVNLDGEVQAVSAVIATQALPLVADLLQSHVEEAYLGRLRRIRYIGNVCLVLELSHSLSDTYWLNVNDPDFPFVGVIEHTNFEAREHYAGRHIVYLSKYLPTTDDLYAMDADELLNFTLPYLKRMFPDFDVNWVIRHTLWKAAYSQPIVEKNYSQLIPERETPVKGLYLASMAQIYPEDRGTNYAIREGRSVGRWLAGRLSKKE